MLTEIRCDKFMDGGTAVHFKEGLNAVLGGGRTQGGKPVFLMAIDFAFGGMDYVSASGHIGTHEIRFCFQFGGERFYFSRSTGNHAVVKRCGEGYVPQSEISVEEFCAFLSEKYGMDRTGAPFREMFGGSFQAPGRDGFGDGKLLAVPPGGSPEEGVRRLLQLFQKYGQVERLRAALKEAEEKARAYEDDFRYRYIPGVARESEYEENKARIVMLLHLQEELARQIGGELQGREAARLAEEKKGLRTLMFEEQKLRSQAEAIKADLDLEKKAITEDFEDLLEFFPDVDIRHLEEIEAFHGQLMAELRSVSEYALDILKARLRLNAYLVEMNRQWSAEGRDEADQEFRASLGRYAEIDREIRRLEAENEYYERTRGMREAADGLRERLDALVADITAEVQNEINRELERLNRIVSGGGCAAPLVRMDGAGGCMYCIPCDPDEGSQAKGMFLFDLALLQNTVLPAVIHDFRASSVRLSGRRW